MSTEQKSSNGALAKLLGQLDLPTVVIVMLMGGGNWLTTRQQGDLSRHELDILRQEVRSEVRDIHTNQDQYLDNVKRVKENQDMLKTILQKLEHQ